MSIAKRIENTKFSTIHKYSGIVKEIKEDGIEVIDLSSAQPLIKTDNTYYEGLSKITPDINGYGDFKGMEKLRLQYSRYYNDKIKRDKYNKDNIQISLGASDAIINILMTICDEGDTIAIIEPFFCDYINYCQMLNINTFCITIDDIANGIGLPKRTKAILFSNPNNPSGEVLKKREMENIIELASKNRLYIISDEVYSEIIFSEFTSFAKYDYEKIIIIDSVSKKFNNCGTRIGAIITKDKEVLNNVSKIYDSRIAISNSEQMAVINMFHNKQQIFDENIKHYEKKVKTIDNLLSKQNIIKYKKPQGSVFFLLTLPIENTEIFAEWLLRKFRRNGKTVLIFPANNFYSNQNNKIRLSMTNNIENIIEALSLLLEAIKEYKGE